MNSPSRRKNNNSLLLDEDVCLNATKTSHKNNLSVHFARLSAVFFYLNELQKRNIVTPSICRPYPVLPITAKKLLIHNAYRKVQQNRILHISKELCLLKEKNVSMCFKTLSYMKLKLKKKKWGRKKCEFEQKCDTGCSNIT